MKFKQIVTKGKFDHRLLIITLLKVNLTFYSSYPLCFKILSWHTISNDEMSENSKSIPHMKDSVHSTVK